MFHRTGERRRTGESRRTGDAAPQLYSFSRDQLVSWVRGLALGGGTNGIIAAIERDDVSGASVPAIDKAWIRAAANNSVTAARFARILGLDRTGFERALASCGVLKRVTARRRSLELATAAAVAVPIGLDSVQSSGEYLRFTNRAAQIVAALEHTFELRAAAVLDRSDAYFKGVSVLQGLGGPGTGKTRFARQWPIVGSAYLSAFIDLCDWVEACEPALMAICGYSELFRHFVGTKLFAATRFSSELSALRDFARALRHCAVDAERSLRIGFEGDALTSDDIRDPERSLAARVLYALVQSECALERTEFLARCANCAFTLAEVIKWSLSQTPFDGPATYSF